MKFKETLNEGKFSKQELDTIDTAVFKVWYEIQGDFYQLNQEMGITNKKEMAQGAAQMAVERALWGKDIPDALKKKAEKNFGELETIFTKKFMNEV